MTARRRLGLVVVPLALAFAPACGGGGAGSGDVVVIAGSAADDGTGYRPVSDGDPVPLISGAQGGFHVWVNVQLEGVMGELTLEREGRRDDTDQLVLAPSRTPLDVPADAMTAPWESPEAAPSFMCPTPVGISVIDLPIRFRVRLLDAEDAVVAEDSFVVRPTCPTADGLAAFCQDICDDT